MHSRASICVPNTQLQNQKAEQGSHSFLSRASHLHKSPAHLHWINKGREGERERERETERDSEERRGLAPLFKPSSKYQHDNLSGGESQPLDLRYDETFGLLALQDFHIMLLKVLTGSDAQRSEK